MKILVTGATGYVGGRPIMTTQKWVDNRTQPLAIRDLLYCLTSAAILQNAVSGISDIGGPEVSTGELT